ncbi:MAG: hypothetical protein JJE04_13145 [Acidobacteriia bacterium]|nr:hypothetical protein [Terriglobia bacterium]
MLLVFVSAKVLAELAEASAARHLRLIERGAEDLRRLSLKLSKAQEDERKSISRELHDQVGQMLTALRIEIVNIEEFRHDAGDSFSRHMADARKLAEETLRTIRDISMGLRPSVLDELGLGPALKWQVREFTRRSGVPVEIQIDGTLDKLADTHRTCVYRLVQEALTNCARHARASQIRITVHGGATANCADSGGQRRGVRRSGGWLARSGTTRRRGAGARIGREDGDLFAALEGNVITLRDSNLNGSEQSRALTTANRCFRRIVLSAGVGTSVGTLHRNR